MPRTSTLRLALLQELQSEPAGSVTELATRVAKLRPSVSRSLNRLREQGFVEFEGGAWQITSSGREEADRATERLRESVVDLNDALAAITARVNTPVVSLEAVRALDSMFAELSAPFKGVDSLLGVDKALRAAKQVYTSLGIEEASRVGSFSANPQWISTLFAPQTDLAGLFREIKLPRWDIPNWQDVLPRWRPDNLQEVPDLNVVVTVALEEGLPFSWVPRPEIVAALIEVDSPEARQVIISERQDDILDDCEARLRVIAHEWSEQCSEAIRALRLELIGPAQSHAANIVDSIVLSRFGKRATATDRASEEFGAQLLRRAAEYVTLLPLLRAFADWWPHTDAAPPDHFSRHTTAHAVGYRGVFAPHSAIIAVMLATSLTVQFASREATTGGVARRNVEASPAP